MFLQSSHKWILNLLIILFPVCAWAQGGTDSAAAPKDSALHRFNIHFQTTYIYQYQPAFHAAYTGPNSLKPQEDKENSITATMYIGARLWKGAELYIDPEIAGGSGLSGAFGMAASTNGETFRVGDPAPTLYLARGYLKQTFALDKQKDTVNDGENQLTSYYTTRSLSLYLGKFSLGDLFDNSPFATGPRTSFMNWCLMNNGAWDYAANLRGYTYSFTAALQWDNMLYKVALATLPTTANGSDLNTNLQQEYSINAEASKVFRIHNREGHVRLLGYYNNGHMGNYKEAIEQAAVTNTVPDVTATQKYGRDKYGVGLNIDQQLTSTLGLFARLGWNDGHNETWCFTEADQTISAGLVDNGAGWKRKDDNAGAAIVVNGLSSEHRQYLADGGLGFQLGDGRLNYANESVLELYYNYKPVPEYNLWLTADYQFALNPGYNQDRGPVNVFSFRVHVEL